jgi:signal transduction histidine kinase
VGGYAELGRLRRRSRAWTLGTKGDPEPRGYAIDERIAGLLAREADLRREFAGRIHDSTLQELAVAKLQIQSVLATQPDPDATRALSGAEAAVDRSISGLRALMYDLGVSKHFGARLEEGLRSLAAHAEARWGIDLHFRCDEVHGDVPVVSRFLLLQGLWELIHRMAERPVSRHGRSMRIG